MYICVLYWNADKSKERFAGSIGTCSNCKGIRQSAGRMSGRNMTLLLSIVKKVDELCAGMLECCCLLRTIRLWAACVKRTFKIHREQMKRKPSSLMYTACDKFIVFWGEEIQKRILTQLADLIQHSMTVQSILHLYCNTVLYHCTVPLYCNTVLYHCTVTLYCTTVL